MRVELRVRPINDIEAFQMKGSAIFMHLVRPFPTTSDKSAFDTAIRQGQQEDRNSELG